MLMGFPLFMVFKGSKGRGAEYRRFFLICGLLAGPLSTAMWIWVSRGMSLLASVAAIVAGNLTITLAVLLSRHLATRKNGSGQGTGTSG